MNHLTELEAGYFLLLTVLSDRCCFTPHISLSICVRAGQGGKGGRDIPAASASTRFRDSLQEEGRQGQEQAGRKKQKERD